MPKVNCKKCTAEIEFSEFREFITCNNCNTSHRYNKNDIRHTVGNTLGGSFKIYNKHRHVNFRNIIFSFIIIISSLTISFSEMDPKWEPMVLAIIILSTLYMLTKNTIVNYESSDLKIKDDILFPN